MNTIFRLYIIVTDNLKYRLKMIGIFKYTLYNIHRKCRKKPKFLNNKFMNVKDIEEVDVIIRHSNTYQYLKIARREFAFL